MTRPGLLVRLPFKKPPLEAGLLLLLELVLVSAVDWDFGFSWLLVLAEAAWFAPGRG